MKKISIFSVLLVIMFFVRCRCLKEKTPWEEREEQREDVIAWIKEDDIDELSKFDFDKLSDVLYGKNNVFELALENKSYKFMEHFKSEFSDYSQEALLSKDRRAIKLFFHNQEDYCSAILAYSKRKQDILNYLEQELPDNFFANFTLSDKDISSGTADEITFMLKKGANINLTEIKTAINQAVERGDLNFEKTLLEHMIERHFNPLPLCITRLRRSFLKPEEEQMLLEIVKKYLKDKSYYSKIPILYHNPQLRIE